MKYVATSTTQYYLNNVIIVILTVNTNIGCSNPITNQKNIKIDFFHKKKNLSIGIDHKNPQLAGKVLETSGFLYLVTDIRQTDIAFLNNVKFEIVVGKRSKLIFFTRKKI